MASTGAADCAGLPPTPPVSAARAAGSAAYAAGTAACAAGSAACAAGSAAPRRRFRRPLPPVPARRRRPLPVPPLRRRYRRATPPVPPPYAAGATAYAAGATGVAAGASHGRSAIAAATHDDCRTRSQ